MIPAVIVRMLVGMMMMVLVVHRMMRMMMLLGSRVERILRMRMLRVVVRKRIGAGRERHGRIVRTIVAGAIAALGVAFTDGPDNGSREHEQQESKKGE